MRSNFPRNLACTFILFAASGLGAVACSGSSGAFTGNAVPTAKTRDMSPAVSASDSTALVEGNTDFAFSLYHAMSTASGGSTTDNLFFSPYSVSLALAMTYAGAHGDTATQMAKALDFTLAGSALHPAFDKLDLAIEAAPTKATGADGAAFALKLADALWGDETTSFQQSFVDTLALDYGAALRTVDFVHQSTEAEAAINAWVAQETNDKIDPLLGPNALDADTRFVIVNAVYFNAGWGTAFDKSQTKPGTFTRADGKQVQTPIMSSDSTASAYAKGSNYQAVELPYSGGTTSMVIVLPDSGAYAAVEKGLGGTFYSAVTSALSTNYSITVDMPSFTFHGKTISLVPELQALGMTDAFELGKADFTAAVPAGDIYISDVVHQAFVDVDESGTEAAAATGVIGETGAVATQPPPAVTIDVDRTFFFFIRDTSTNTILFAGREDDPTAG